MCDFFSETLIIINEAQSFIAEIDKIPIGCSLLNGGVSFFVALIALPTYSKSIILSQLKKFQETLNVSNYKYSGFFYYWRYIIATSLLTGIASAALLASQKAHISIPTAVAYGFAGPFFLKKKMLELAGSKEIKKLSVGVGEVVNEEEKDYNKEMERIKAELEKLSTK
jgi:hypothetical protein